MALNPYTELTFGLLLCSTQSLLIVGFYSPSLNEGVNMTLQFTSKLRRNLRTIRNNSSLISFKSPYILLLFIVRLFMDAWNDSLKWKWDSMQMEQFLWLYWIRFFMMKWHKNVENSRMKLESIPRCRQHHRTRQSGFVPRNYSYGSNVIMLIQLHNWVMSIKLV